MESEGSLQVANVSPFEGDLDSTDDAWMEAVQRHLELTIQWFEQA
jgi:hypothetical protein